MMTIMVNKTANRMRLDFLEISLLVFIIIFLRAEGVDIAIISRQLGHRSISTTARYLDHLAPLAVIEAMRGRGW